MAFQPAEPSLRMGVFLESQSLNVPATQADWAFGILRLNSTDCSLRFSTVRCGVLFGAGAVDRESVLVSLCLVCMFGFLSSVGFLASGVRFRVSEIEFTGIGYARVRKKMLWGIHLP